MRAPSGGRRWGSEVVEERISLFLLVYLNILRWHTCISIQVYYYNGQIKECLHEFG